MTTSLTTRLGGLLLAAALPLSAQADDMKSHDMTSHDMAGMDHMGDHAEMTEGDLTFTGAFTRATLPGAPVGGGFVTIENSGTTDMRLTGATTPAAARVEVHEMAMDGDVMRMRELPDGLPIPAGETVVLEPGGYHLMFMELAGPLVEGETVPVTLEIEGAEPVTLPFATGPMNARANHGDH